MLKQSRGFTFLFADLSCKVLCPWALFRETMVLSDLLKRKIGSLSFHIIFLLPNLLLKQLLAPPSILFLDLPMLLTHSVISYGGTQLINLDVIAIK